MLLNNLNKPTFISQTNSTYTAFHNKPQTRLSMPFKHVSPFMYYYVFTSI